MQGRCLLGMALAGDAFGYEGRIQEMFTRALKEVVITMFTSIMELSRSWPKSFKSGCTVPVMALQLVRRCPVSPGGFEFHDPFIAI